jgi:signal transduction histidine kinase
LLGGTNPPRIGRVSTRDVATSGPSGYRVTLIEDQTADRRREAAMADALTAARAASDAKARFTASVSHEIRTPLNGIIGMLDLMALDRLSVDQTQRLQTARTSSDHLLDILNDILDAASLEAGTFEIRRSDAPLAPLLTATLAAFEGRAAAKGIALASTIDVAVPATLHTDPRRLRQILSNLIGNAIKFTQRGEVALHATIREGVLHCAIIDTGPGIAPDDLGKLFARFVQLDNSSTRLHQGTGLGLAIAQELTTALGGTIGVASALGKGTTFWFTHPLTATPSSLQLHAAMPPLQIMIADDNKTNRLVARKMLETLGHRVVEAADGAQAVALGLQMTCDIILMDWQMPGMDGLEATRRLIAANCLPRFGVIALTAHAGVTVP